MYLSALSVGEAVPNGDFAASVHSAFQSALNLRLRGKNNLLTLLASGEDDLPQGIRLDTPGDFSFEEFQVGEPALCQDGILHFENHSLTIQLHGARSWKCDLSTLEFDATSPAVSAAWRRVWDALNERQRLKGSEIIAEELFRENRFVRAGISYRVGEAMKDLVTATRGYELTDTFAINSLIGLGSGLTPAGDDLLVGYMAGLWCTVRGSSLRLEFLSSLRNTVIDFSLNTNDISRTYLYHAARGQVSSRLENLAEAICLGESLERLLGIAQTAMSVGHTSGMDAVTGLLLGLTAWEGNDLLPV